MSDNPYEVLGVEITDDYKTIQKVYRDLAKKYHPDLNPGNPEAEEKFKQISAAWDILSDPVKKGRFDNLSRDRRRGAAFGMAAFEEILKRTGFGGNPFHARFSEKPKPNARQGENLEHEITVSPLSILLGESIEVDFEKKVPCPTCGGRGADFSKCPQCHGLGSLTQELHSQSSHIIRNIQCPTCGGRGWVPENSCEACGGVGLVEEPRVERVDLRGIVGPTHNAVKIIPGGGHYGAYGGGPGGLIIKVIPLYPSAEHIPISAQHHLRKAKGIIGHK